MKRSFIIFGLLLLLAGCNYNKQTQNKHVINTLQAQSILSLSTNYFELIELDIQLDKSKYADALLDDSIIFQSVNREGRRSYYRYFFADGTFLEIGSIENSSFSMGQKEIIDNIIYFNSSVVDSDNQELASILFGIDLENNQLLEFSRDFPAMPLINVFYLNGNLASIKHHVEDNIQTTYLEMLSLADKNTSSTGLESHYDRNTGIGSIKLLHTTDQNLVYILYDTNLTEQDEWSAFIRVYNENMEHYRDINFDNEANFILDWRPWDLNIFGDYIHIHNAAIQSLLGRIEQDGSITPLHIGALVQSRTRNISTMVNTQLFFERFTNNIVLLDTTTGTINEVALDLDEGYQILYVLTNGNVAFICVANEDLTEYRYFMTHFPVQLLTTIYIQ